MAMSLTLSRRYSLPALHVLAGSEFTAEDNLRTFGGCSRLHGHEYLVEVTVTGPVEADSGWILSRDHLDQVVETALLRPFRGTNLSDHFPHTTGEALSLAFLDLLRDRLGAPARLVEVTVRETAKNSFSARVPEPDPIAGSR